MSPLLSMQLPPCEVSVDYYSCPPRIVSLLMLTIIYIQSIAFNIHRPTQGGFNSHTVHSLYRITIMTTSVEGVTKMGNIVPRAEIEPTSLAFQASVLPLYHVCSLISPLYPYMQLLASEVNTAYYTSNIQDKMPDTYTFRPVQKHGWCWRWG